MPDLTQRALDRIATRNDPKELETIATNACRSLEGLLKELRRKIAPLFRTRQKIARDCEVAAVSNLVRKPASDGYNTLIERGWPQLTFKAIALRYPERSEGILKAAGDRLNASMAAPNEPFSITKKSGE